MKTLVNTLMTIAAGTLALGSMAYGQTILKADIPFEFHASGGTLPAGSYTVIHEYRSGGYSMRLFNTNTGRGALVASGQADSHNSGSPEVVFLCGSHGCSLSAIRSMRGTVTVPGTRRMKKEDQTASVVSFPLLAAR